MSQLKQMIQSGQITPHILAKIDDVSHSVKELNTIIEERSMLANNAGKAETDRVLHANSNSNNNMSDEAFNMHTAAMSDRLDKLEKNITLLMLGSLASFTLLLSSYMFNR